MFVVRSRSNGSTNLTVTADVSLTRLSQNRYFFSDYCLAENKQKESTSRPNGYYDYFKSYQVLNSSCGIVERDRRSAVLWLVDKFVK